MLDLYKHCNISFCYIINKNIIHRLSRRKENVSEQLNMRRKADREKLSGWACWKCEKVIYKYLQCNYTEHLYAVIHNAVDIYDKNKLFLISPILLVVLQGLIIIKRRVARTKKSMFAPSTQI